MWAAKATFGQGVFYDLLERIVVLDDEDHW